MSVRGIRRERTPLEVAVLLVSAVAVAAIVIGLLLARIAGGNGPPDLRVSVAQTPIHRSGGAVYAVIVRNVGGETAANVVIEVVVGEETREISLVSVAKGDDEEAAAVFPSGTSGEPRATVTSYHRATRD
ncbi:MAG: hypothetical protein WDA27_00040 [Actinomycetota bacterium]